MQDNRLFFVDLAIRQFDKSGEVRIVAPMLIIREYRAQIRPQIGLGLIRKRSKAGEWLETKDQVILVS